MKVAIYDLTAYESGGDVTWVQQFKEGLRQVKGLGYTHYRFSKPWWADPEAVRLPKTASDIADLLTNYDLVVVPEAWGGPMDREAKKTGKPPRWYIPLKMAQNGVPVVAGLHRMAYHKDLMFAWFLVACNGFFMTSPRFLEGIEDGIQNKYQKVLPYLPFTPGLGAETGFGIYPAEVVIAGRVKALKNQRILAALADKLTKPVGIWGRAMMPFGVSSTQKLLDTLLLSGFELKDPLFRVNVGKEDRWTVTAPGTKNEVRYHGGYANPEQPYWNAAAAVCLTSEKFSPGHLEYVTLEAMAAGIPVAVPEHQTEGLDYVWGPAFWPLPFHDHVDYDKGGCVRVLNRLAVASPGASQHRDALLLHDAGVYAHRLVEWGVGCGLRR